MALWQSCLLVVQALMFNFFQMVAFLNESFKQKGSTAAILTHYWPPSYNNACLKHVTLTLNCWDIRKYSKGRLTGPQRESKLLQGRSQRALTMLPAELGGCSFVYQPASVFQWHQEIVTNWSWWMIKENRKGCAVWLYLDTVVLYLPQCNTAVAVMEQMASSLIGKTLKSCHRSGFVLFLKWSTSNITQAVFYD